MEARSTYNIGGVRLVPALVVQSTDLALRTAVQSSEVRSEELAGLGVGASRVVGKDLIVVSLASGLAQVGVKEGAGEDADAEVGVLIVVVTRGVDGSVTQIDARVAIKLGDAGLHVAIGAGNDDVELVAPLALVVGALLGDVATPENTLDLGGRVGVLTAGARLLKRLTLKVDVDT